ncbi:MAG: SDR family oxidoreductase [Planctomycetaceae bacterium]|jgi:UDP-glucose 4-epimerase|nr:SDR family oxidoreductase [bacterium]MDB4679658.1 SDR family oxidoreductase [Planctomycetaceae bacterium]MDG2390455.1 SDR family oxidoreductase [Planctomycetaceae bacterium]
MAECLVTGGAGFIGSHLVAGLIRAGHQVTVLDNLSTGHLGNLAGMKRQYRLIEGDCADPHVALSAVNGVDCVFHLGAIPSVPLSLDDPLGCHHYCTTATVSMLDACRQAGVRRFVLASSCSVYGERPDLPKSEDQLPQTISPYSAAKLASEQFCEAFAACFSLETVCLRYFNVYGPRQDPKGPYSAVIPLFIDAFRAGEQPTIFGDGRQSRDFVYVEDVVQANLKAAFTENISGEVFNIGTGQSTTLLDLVDQISDLLEVDANPNFQEARSGDVRHAWADISKSCNRLGFEPVFSLSEGLRKTVNSYLR